MLIQVFLNPTKAFEQLFAAAHRHHRFLLGYALPLLVIGAFGRTMSTLIRHEAFREAFLSGEAYWTSFFIFCLHWLVFVISICIGSSMLARLASHFGGDPSRGVLLKLILLAYTPFLIVQPIAALGGYWTWFGFAGLTYTVILYVLGLRHQQCYPEKNIIGFTLISFFILLGTSYILTRMVFAFFIFES